jgi:hypothetical protein
MTQDTHTEALSKDERLTIILRCLHERWPIAKDLTNSSLRDIANAFEDAIEALPARTDERALKLVEAIKTAIQHAYEEGVEDGIGWEAAPMGDPQPQWIDSVARVTSLQLERALASQEQS